MISTNNKVEGLINNNGRRPGPSILCQTCDRGAGGPPQSDTHWRQLARIDSPGLAQRLFGWCGSRRRGSWEGRIINTEACEGTGGREGGASPVTASSPETRASWYPFRAREDPVFLWAWPQGPSTGEHCAAHKTHHRHSKNIPGTEEASRQPKDILCILFWPIATNQEEAVMNG